MNIFLDTGAFYALADSSDSHHAAASKYYTSAVQSNRFLTSSFVLVETWLLIRNKLGYRAAQSFSQGIRKGIVTVIDVTEQDLDRAWTIQGDYADQEFSLVDAVSFAIMERLGFATAFSFDVHFKVYRHGTKKQEPLAIVP